MPLTLRFHPEHLALCKLASTAPVPSDILAHPLTCFFRTRKEATLICPSALAPQDVESEPGWIALEFVGAFDFALTGILTQVATPLAEVGISIFALSSFTTDYVLIKSENRDAAIAALRQAGHSFI